jgi:hypothetical protein
MFGDEKKLKVMMRTDFAFKVCVPSDTHKKQDMMYGNTRIMESS